MKETEFINQNKQKWSELESELSEQSRDAQKLSRLFVQVTDDLSYSRTFYPNRSVKVYLNNLTQLLYFSLYRNDRFSWKKFADFWKRDLPELVYICRKELLLSLSIFIGAVIIGVFSSIHDPHFAESILGKGYIETTLQNIRSGDPMGIYKSGGSTSSFLGITLNNINVAFMAFVLGIFCCLGTIFLLIYNGIMVGAFQYFFIERDLFFSSFQTIWLHGTIEISSIIIAGGAGIILGKGLVWPGTYTRMQSFRIGAQRALQILMGVVPLFIIAGFIEGFISRYTDAPVILKLTVIILSALFIIGYFIIHPYRLYRRGHTIIHKEVELQPELSKAPDLSMIRSNGEIIHLTFAILSNNITRLIFFAIPLASIYSLLLVFVVPSDIYKYFHSSDKTNVLKFFMYDDALLIFGLNIILFSLMLFYAILQVKELHALQGKSPRSAILFRTVTIIAVSLAFGFWTEVWSLLIFLALLPLIIEAYIISVHKGKGLVSSISEAIGLFQNALLKPFGIYFTILILFGAAVLLVNSSLFYYYLDVVSWNFQFDAIMQNAFLKFLLTCILVFICLVVVFMAYIAGALLHFSLDEIQHAEGLKSQLNKVFPE